MPGGGDHTSPALLKAFAIRTRHNEESTLIFVGVLLLVGGIFTIFHQLRESSHWMQRRKGRSHVPAFLVGISRLIRKASLRVVPGMPTIGHATVVTVFVVINAISLFAHFEGTNLITNVASRAAWLSIANIVFVIFFALKNTPLAFLTAWSYERLNYLHRVAGYTAVAHAIIHGTCYSVYFVGDNRSFMLLRSTDILGMVSGISLVFLALGGMLIRRWWYELFYYSHIFFWILGIVSIGRHQPDISKKIIIAAIVAGSLWGLDRVIRFVRLAVHSSNNTARLTQLPNGGTRVTFFKKPILTEGGKHCFLWIPRIRMFETHPFTIVASNPLEFVVASHNGFTRDLHNYALAHPFVSLKASVEGPYGTAPDASGFETVVLVGAGSGGSFIFGLADALLGKPPRNITKRIVLVWVMKYNSYLTWFDAHLSTLSNDGRFSIQLYVTRSKEEIRVAAQPDMTTSSAMETAAKALELEDEKMPPQEAPQMLHHVASDSSIDLEHSRPGSDTESVGRIGANHPSHTHGIPIKYERPNVPELIRSAVAQTGSEHRVLVTGCGPAKLMNVLRNTTAECISTDGPSIELHCEQFGW